MKTKEIEIAGKKLLLYERSVKDVEELRDFLKEKQLEEIIDISFFNGLQILISSLRRNIPNKPNRPRWYMFIKLREWRKIVQPIIELEKFLSYESLRAKVTVSELEELVENIYLLEGIDIKKKVSPEAENILEKKLQNG